jgi:hypothetical protein
MLPPLKLGPTFLSTFGESPTSGTDPMGWMETNRGVAVLNGFSFKTLKVSERCVCRP